ncbi:SpoIIE family protein phosphatase [Candidatus Poribacteria bacterium]|nr:SpoIIE family protein phosphatase [Candidatus Poribacteria bacterium]
MTQNTADLTNAKILIVDDIPANLNVLRQTLETEGYRIVAAPNGTVALQVADRTRPDLILLDVMMPEMDGFETCRRLKASAATAEIPVIFITAKDDMGSIVEGFKVGGVDYITKPFRQEEVRVRVHTHLTIKRLQDGLREANQQIQAKNEALERAYAQLAADNLRKTEELETARRIQQGFLPVSTPELPYLEIAAFQKTATEVGGDYYDFFPKDDGKLVIAIGDATGHGVGASLMVSATKMALRLTDEPNLVKKISKINTHLKQINSYPRLNMALTLIELAYDENSGDVQIKAAGGGMPPLYILRADGKVEEMMIEGVPLGAMERVKYGFTEFRLEPSELLICMSDGLPERMNDAGEPFGYAQIVTELKKAGKTEKRAQEIMEILVRASDEWSNKTPQDDDVTLVVLKHTGSHRSESVR